jgi:hypothetical protein
VPRRPSSQKKVTDNIKHEPQKRAGRDVGDHVTF